jgi:hypothetical protein
MYKLLLLLLLITWCACSKDVHFPTPDDSSLFTAKDSIFYANVKIYTSDSSLAKNSYYRLNDDATLYNLPYHDAVSNCSDSAGIKTVQLYRNRYYMVTVVSKTNPDSAILYQWLFYKYPEDCLFANIKRS